MPYSIQNDLPLLECMDVAIMVCPDDLHAHALAHHHNDDIQQMGRLVIAGQHLLVQLGAAADFAEAIDQIQTGSACA